MSGPTVRDEVLRAWSSILVRAGCKASHVDAIVQELAQAAEGRGVHLPRRPRIDDPNAVALQPPTAPPATDAASHAATLRASVRPYGGVDRRADREPSDHLPQTPQEPQ